MGNREAFLVERRASAIKGREETYLRGGRGEALLLVHGGWGGAELHWSKVLSPLARHFDVIAPDLPGFCQLESAGPKSVADYADWLAALMTELGVAHAWVVGNSFGASVAASFASRFSARCLGLVMVNGFPMPRTPGPLLWLGERAPGRALLRRIVRHQAFSPRRVAEAFYDPRNVPPQLLASLGASQNAPLERMVDAFVLGGEVVSLASMRVLLLWGEDDHLKASRREAAMEIADRIERARLVFIPRAGHCPQLEQPDAFVRALCTFAGHG